MQISSFFYSIYHVFVLAALGFPPGTLREANP